MEPLNSDMLFTQQDLLAWQRHYDPPAQTVLSTTTDALDLSASRLERYMRLDHITQLIKPTFRIPDFTSATNFSHIRTILYKSIDVVCSLSSKLMTQLMSARNSENQSGLRKIWHITKVVATEVALPFVTVAATIETAVYSLLHLGAKVLKPVSNRPMEWISNHKILQSRESSTFTIWWSVAMLYDNIVMRSLHEDESSARSALQPRSERT